MFIILQTSSLLQITKAISAFMREHADGARDSVTEDKENKRSSEKLDALEVKLVNFFFRKPKVLLSDSTSYIWQVFMRCNIPSSGFPWMNHSPKVALNPSDKKSYFIDQRNPF